MQLHHETVLQPKKIYTTSETLPEVANVIAKLRSMQSLSAKEELVYLIQVKNLSKEEAKKIIDNKSKDPEII